MLWQAILMVPVVLALCLVLRRYLQPDSRWAPLVSLLPILITWYGTYLVGELFLDAFGRAAMYKTRYAISGAAWVGALVMCGLS